MNWTQMIEDLRAVRAENEVNLQIRRGATTIAAQPMRIEYAGMRGYLLQSDAARQAAQAVYILMEPDANIQAEDRLTYEGHVIRVVFIQLNRRAATIAEGVVVE